MTDTATSTKRPGLRERKKQQTRQTISDIATGLFMLRGFDQVTLAEVAEAANVSVNTIFNYFSTKEELFFDRAEEVLEEPSRIVRERHRGESVVDAMYRAGRESLRAPDGVFNRASYVKPFFATVEASPALKLHVRALFDESEDRLTRTLAAETHAGPEDPTPRAVASMLIGQQRMLLNEFITRLLRDESDTKIRAALQRTLDRGYALIRSGASHYGIKGSAG
jgi:AcrR family transcriptional regulator